MYCYFDNLNRVLLEAVAELVMDRAIEEVVNYAHAIKKTHKVHFIGNGGSASIASHQATDWSKNGGYAALAFNDGAQLTCIANDLGYDKVFELPLYLHAKPHDLLFAISSSGRSRNILNGVRAGLDLGCKVVTLSGFDADNPLRGMGWRNFYVPSSSYGFVEISHLAILHAILDKAMSSGVPLSGGCVGQPSTLSSPEIPGTHAPPASTNG